MQRLIIASLISATCSTSYALDYYLFPVKEIEGLNFQNKASNSRPLLDQRVVTLFTASTQKQLAENFAVGLERQYPQSIVHSSQVRDAVRGKYAYAKNGVACGESFVAPANRSYAVVIGITRASYYEVDKGDSVETLIPVTLNLQLIKPDLGKIVFSISSTQYTPFLLSKGEIGTPATEALITNTLVTNITNQLNDLLENLKKGFNPQDTPVKLVEKFGNYWVTDKGFEVGFKEGDEFEATGQGTKSSEIVIFKALSVDQGYAVLKALNGSPAKGETYAFTFETAADDSRKPKLLPVWDEKEIWSLGVSDLFAKDIGFKAPFQITPVDVNFKDNMNTLKRVANCVPWDKYASASTIENSRSDSPNFFLRFEMAQSPVFTSTGQRGVNTEEFFSTALTAQVVDNDGKVVFSEIGRDDYSVKKTSGKGLNIFNAKEISLKNALLDLNKNFLNNVKFQPKQLRISEVGQGKFKVPGLEVPTGQRVTYQILKPLNTNIGNKPAFMQVKILESAEDPVTADGATTFSYTLEPDYPEIKPGDLLSILKLPDNQPEATVCSSPFVGKDSYHANYLLPTLSHHAYRSAFFNVGIADAAFYESTNNLLKQGFYKLRVRKPTDPELCIRPGYVVKKSDASCTADGCSVKFLTALRLTTMKSGSELKDASIAEQSILNGVSEVQIDSAIGYRAMINANKTLSKELEKKLNSK